MEVVPQNNLIDRDLSLSGLGDSISLPSTPDRKRTYSQEKPYLKPKPKNIPSSVLRGLTKPLPDITTRAVSMLPVVPTSANPVPTSANPVPTPRSQEPAHSPGETQVSSPSRVTQYPAFRSRPLRVAGPSTSSQVLETRDPSHPRTGRHRFQRTPSSVPSLTRRFPLPSRSPNPVPAQSQHPLSC